METILDQRKMCIPLWLYYRSYYVREGENLAFMTWKTKAILDNEKQQVDWETYQEHKDRLQIQSENRANKYSRGLRFMYSMRAQVLGHWMQGDWENNKEYADRIDAEFARPSPSQLAQERQADMQCKVMMRGLESQQKQYDHDNVWYRKWLPAFEWICFVLSGLWIVCLLENLF